MLPRKFYLDSIFDDLLNEETPVDMKCDVYEKDGNYHIEADVPGIDKKDISIECDGKSQRRFYVGNVDSETIKANFDNGVLNITIPKQEEKKSTKLISID